jgi:predicted methyltransferase
MRLHLLASMVVAGCATQRVEGPRTSRTADSQQIVASPDRTDRDRAMDAHRKPVEMLAFFGVAPGQRVADLGAGGGYSTELFARAVGPAGVVFAQDTPDWDGPGLKKAWEARLARPVMRNTTHSMRYWDDPLPPEAKNLDAVYSVAVYHDAIAEKRDTAKMNQAVFAALKPGGVYAIVDNSAKPGTGAAEANTLHRIDEQFLRDEVQRAGFVLAGTADFLRNPQDPRDWNADSTVNKIHTQDRFVLKFVKPG